MSVQKVRETSATARASGRGGDTTPSAEPPKRRGRPRAFDSGVALKQAQDAFRDTGFSATSLDDLSAAMGINRPSLYGAFGDKRELFIAAYQQYRSDMAELFAPAFDPKLTLRASLRRIFDIAIGVYVSGLNGPRGCFSVMTAASEAMADDDIRDLVQKAMIGTDRLLAERCRLAKARGEIAADADCDALARLASAALQSIALRARARLPRAELETLARGAVDLIAGGRKSKVRAR